MDDEQFILCLIVLTILFLLYKNSTCGPQNVVVSKFKNGNDNKSKNAYFKTLRGYVDPTMEAPYQSIHDLQQDNFLRKLDAYTEDKPLYMNNRRMSDISAPMSGDEMQKTPGFTYDMETPMWHGKKNMMVDDVSGMHLNKFDAI